jgi:hypothetical protein
MLGIGYGGMLIGPPENIGGIIVMADCIIGDIPDIPIPIGPAPNPLGTFSFYPTTCS